MNEKKLIYNEYKQIGTDYNDLQKVINYDNQMLQFRDKNKEIAFIIDKVKLKKEHNVLDIGIGTGFISLELAKYCHHLYAIDVSKEMIDYAENKAKSMNIENITFYNNGFLDYKHNGYRLDIIISQLAFHHLPDFWKVIALKRINDILQTGGIFYLEDRIFSFKADEYEERLRNWYNFVKNIDRKMADEVEAHIKTEYSTFDWLIDAMLAKLGYEYTKTIRDNTICVYCCVKL